MKQSFGLFFILLILCKVALCQNYPKREFRGVWVTTFANLDWPSQKNLSTEKQKAEFINLVNNFQKTGINAVFVQVRPSGDAFYPSKLAPWSEFLTGKQGKAPEPFYDPLAFMIEECHARNIEFHAWFNPYRAISNHEYSNICPQNIINSQPSWVFKYGNGSYLNPGEPDVTNYFIKVVMEVVTNYDIDGIHFDDYYYPYPIYPKQLPDAEQYAKYGKSFDNVSAWRRNNIDEMIRRVNEEIKAHKPYVKLGIGPLGVWRNNNMDPSGSISSTSESCYDNLYCDVKKWLNQGWIDYVSPQLYWGVNHKSANYLHLSQWWNDQNFKQPTYAGLAIYKVGTVWKNDSELPNMIKIARQKENFEGVVFYRAKSFTDNPRGVLDTLKRNYFKYPALVPAMPWLDSLPPAKPSEPAMLRQENLIELKWSYNGSEKPFYYVIYRFNPGQIIDLSSTRNILSLTKNTFYNDPTVIKGVDYTYIITAVDRSYNESDPLYFLLPRQFSPSVTTPED